MDRVMERVTEGNACGMGLGDPAAGNGGSVGVGAFEGVAVMGREGKGEGMHQEKTRAQGETIHPFP